jgi:hypothetical protein
MRTARTSRISDWPRSDTNCQSISVMAAVVGRALPPTKSFFFVNVFEVGL